MKEHVTEASALFAVDKVVKQFNEGVISVSKLFSFVPSLKKVVRLLGKAVALAASYIDEAIVAYVFVNGEQNRWQSARDGVVLYGKTGSQSSHRRC